MNRAAPDPAQLPTLEHRRERQEEDPHLPSDRHPAGR